MRAGSLICVECQAQADDQAWGWQAYLADVDDDGEFDVVLFCPSCAGREFSDAAADE